MRNADEVAAELAELQEIRAPMVRSPLVTADELAPLNARRDALVDELMELRGGPFGVVLVAGPTVMLLDYAAMGPRQFDLIILQEEASILRALEPMQRAQNPHAKDALSRGQMDFANSRRHLYVLTEFSATWNNWPGAQPDGSTATPQHKENSSWL